MRIVSSSPRITKELATILAHELARLRPHARHATVIALRGPLGAGKTTFVQALARALGVRRNLPSPTFIFSRRYPLRLRCYGNLFHVDAYRVQNATKKFLSPLGLLDNLKNPRNLFVIEWAERLGHALPPETLRVTFRHGTREEERIITFSARKK